MLASIFNSPYFYPSIYHWLVLSSALFSIGIYGFLTRKNAVGILISLELCLNSGALNFVVFDYFRGNHIDGKIMALFIIAVAAAEVVIAMAIFVGMFKHKKTIDVTEMNQMRN
ncbi:MAG: NADH-quinone oxidoreductase subunit NuoK [Deltaproteobacteria bacterium]|nr:NADH-quinone oxidoreductase subunit NuoK [Deltaproteobacteria bacterium]